MTLRHPRPVRSGLALATSVSGSCTVIFETLFDGTTHLVVLLAGVGLVFASLSPALQEPKPPEPEPFEIPAALTEEDRAWLARHASLSGPE